MSQKPSSRLSLRTVLIVPYVALLLGLASTIAVLSYFAGQHAVLKVAEHLLVETVGRIGQAVDRHVVGSGAVLEAAFPDGVTAPPDITPDVAMLRTRFWIATSLHIDPNNYVYYGNRAGQAMGVFRNSLQEGELRIKLDPKQNRGRYKFTGINGTAQFESTEAKFFDPRERPWYKAAAAASTDTWTSVYIDFGTEELVATRARRVLAADGELAGVVATDMSLRALNDFVRNIKLSAHGTAFIIEPNGDLIASSSSPNVRHVDNGASTRINAASSGNTLLTEIYQQVKLASVDGAVPGEGRTLVFRSSDGQDIHVGYETITDSGGLRWITIAAMPSGDFMGGVTENLWRTVVISAFAAFVALSLGLWILQWVVGDLKRLTTTAKDLGEGRLSAPLNIVRPDEIGELAKAFATMQHFLQTDRLTGLANRDAFERRVNAEIDDFEEGRRTVGFGILFIDLNGFKAINDRYGHDVGDAVLIEVGRRLAAALTPGNLAARYAGDEFVVMLHDTDDPESITPVKKILYDALRQSLVVATHDGTNDHLELDAAIGQAHFPTDAQDAAALVKLADRDMYRRKQANN